MSQRSCPSKNRRHFLRLSLLLSVVFCALFMATASADEILEANQGRSGQPATLDLTVSIDQEAIFEEGMRAWLKDRRKESLAHFERLAALSAGEAIGEFELLFWSRLDDARYPKTIGAEFLKTYLKEAKPDPFNQALALKLLAHRQRWLGEPMIAETTLAEAGVIQELALLGPLPSNADLCGLAKPNEAILNFEAEYKEKLFSSRWRPLGDKIKFGELRPSRLTSSIISSCAWAAARIRVEEDLEAVLRLSYAGSIALWVNGAKIKVHNPGTGVRFAETADAPAHLKKGDNLLLIKTASNGAGKDWRLSLRLSDPQGKPLKAKVNSDLKAMPASPETTPAAPAFSFQTSPLTRLTKQAESKGVAIHARTAWAFADLMLRFEGEQTDLAKSIALEAIKRKSLSAAFYLLLHNVEKDPNLAVRMLDLANDQPGDCIRCRAARAKIFQEDFERPHMAKTQLQRALDSNPESVAALNMAFDLAMAQDDFETAWKYLQKMEAASEAPSIQPAILSRRRKLIKEGALPGGPKKVGEMLIAELEQNPLAVEKVDLLAAAMMIGGGGESRFETLRNKLEKLQQLNPDVFVIPFQIAKTWRAQEKEDEAIDQLRIAADSFPHNANLKEQIGQWLYEAGRNDEAREAFEAALAINDRLKTAVATLAHLEKMKKEESAK